MLSGQTYYFPIEKKRSIGFKSQPSGKVILQISDAYEQGRRHCDISQAWWKYEVEEFANVIHQTVSLESIP